MARSDPDATWLAPPAPIADGLKIGLLGGSFNPAHDGHLYVSETARKQLGLDYVWWLVSPQNPLKPEKGMAPLHERLALAQTFARDRRIVVLALERALGTRYTIDTLRALKHRFPRLHFVWLMGSDNLESFGRWRSWPEIVQRVPVAVVLRPGSSLAPLRAKAMQRFGDARVTNPHALAHAKPPAIAILDGRRSEASATALRAKAPR